MKIIRVFPRRTSYTPEDDMVFVGDPQLERPDANEVHVSCTFTWDKQGAERLKLAWEQYYPLVKVGGPAYEDPGNNFTPGMYVKRGVIVTSRGCNHQCPWCLAWRREGLITLLPIQEGWILQDNNILQCPLSHIDAVFDMLGHQHHVELTGGIEASQVTQYIADRIRGLRIRQIFLACDTDAAIKPLRKAMKLLQLPPHDRRARCYVLLKYDPEETMLQALIRLLQVWETGCIPFAQLYQPPDHWIEYSKEWKRFARLWERPAASYGYVTRLLKQIEKSGV